jgi:hypothetical protein
MVNGNTNMADERICELGSILEPVTIGPLNDVRNIGTVKQEYDGCMK